MARVSFHHLGKAFGQCSTLTIGVNDLRCPFSWGQNSMLLPSLGSVVHVAVAEHILHEFSCLFHHSTVMSLKFSDRQI